MSIRKAGEALGMDKSKVLRLKRRAEASGLLGPAVSAQPAAASHCLTEGVSHFAGPNVRTIHPAARLAAPLAKVRGVGRDEALAAEEAAETGCLLSLPDGKGGYRPCGYPVGADGVFCEAQEIPRKVAPLPVVSIANKTMANMARNTVELGMTPSLRSRVTAPEPSDNVIDLARVPLRRCNKAVAIAKLDREIAKKAFPLRSRLRQAIPGGIDP